MLCDPTRLEQAFGNILNNASKYTPREGHIWVTAEQRSGGDHAAEVVVRVRDDGIGVSPDLLPHVFEMFKQGSASPHHAPRLGVGLALVRSVLTLHGAHVSVRSEGENQGSEFTIVVTLLNADAHVESDQLRIPEPAENAARRILVVDDNADAADT
ncbi:MAG: sensor histidine kinase, partial [Vicinamibacterales bacterium]